MLFFAVWEIEYFLPTSNPDVAGFDANSEPLDPGQ